MKAVGEGILSGREEGGLIRQGSFEEGGGLADSFIAMASPVGKPSAPLLKPLTKSNSNGVTQVTFLADNKLAQ